MPDEIRTERLLLRRARLEDAEAMHAIMSDPQVMRYWWTPPHRNLAETEEWIASIVKGDDDFIVTLDGALIGKLGARKLPAVGFVIDRAHWGKGYASEALAAFIDRRRTLGSRELTATADPRNDASLKVLARHGFIETHRATRDLRVGDEWCDTVYLRRTI